MSKRLKLYFDTSVFNFAFADDAPDKKAMTLKLIEEIKAGKYEVYISTIVLREIKEAPTEKEVVGTNLLLGYKELEIYSPMEVIDND